MKAGKTFHAAKNFSGAAAKAASAKRKAMSCR